MTRRRRRGRLHRRAREALRQYGLTVATLRFHAYETNLLYRVRDHRG